MGEGRYVLVDGRMPLLQEMVFGRMGPYGLAEKAYAKFRYCYKGILGVGVQQILYELTGVTALRYTADSEKERQALVGTVSEHLTKGVMVVAVGEGEADKPLLLDGQETPFTGVRPYLLMGAGEGKTSVMPGGHSLSLVQAVELFRSVFV